jgi:hypothetical protein
MMKKTAVFLFASIASIGAAFALSDSSIPTKVPTTWGTSAPGGNIVCPMPILSQIGVTPGRASWTDGFPPLTFSPSGAGGIPPFGSDFNGVLCQLSQWTRWYNAGAPVSYDSTFQTAIGGYPNGAVVRSAVTAGLSWRSTVDNNTSNPDTGGANWVNAQAPAFSLGTSGYYTLPGGLIAQWGTIAAAAVNSDGDLGAFSFPITFPNAVFQVSISTNQPNPVSGAYGNNARMVSLYGVPTTSLFHAFGNTPYGGYSHTGFSWYAIGN